ncbi:MAG: hypothetical protein ACI9BK_002668 [Acidimicrobiales bacterium]|jgi:uncharacterized protein (DUF1015 family)
MTSLLRPFSGFIPTAEYAPRIVGPPSSMLSRKQKKASRNDELSFRHVVGRGASAGHTEAMNWLDRCIDLGALQPVESALIVHRLTRGTFSATGIIADVSLSAYDTGLIKRHETTIAKTQRKMLQYMEATRIFGNPVALAHRDHPELAVSLAHHSRHTADLLFESVDGTQHSLWVVTGTPAQTMCDSFSDVLYITDGHHRLAAASALAEAEGRPNPHLPAALFAEDELTLGAFARAIDDEDVVATDVLTWLDERFDLQEVSQKVARPATPHQVGVRLDGRSFLLRIPPAAIPTDTYDRLDVNLLQDLVLEPLFGVTNPRTDQRLRFIADTSDDHDVDSCAAWFLPYPTSVPDVMIVADTGRAMPPKSTYFMPKVPSGLVIRPVDVD